MSPRPLSLLSALALLATVLPAAGQEDAAERIRFSKGKSAAEIHGTLTALQGEREGEVDRAASPGSRETAGASGAAPLPSCIIPLPARITTNSACITAPSAGVIPLAERITLAARRVTSLAGGVPHVARRASSGPGGVTYAAGRVMHGPRGLSPPRSGVSPLGMDVRYAAMVVMPPMGERSPVGRAQ